MSSNDLRAALLAFACAVVCGCSSAPRYVQMYDGPEQREMQAIVKVDPTVPQGRLGIHAVDGRSTSTTSGVVMNNGNWPHSAGVLPGEHTVRCESRVGTASAEADLRWFARAGATYLIKYDVRGYYTQMWITDARTGATVGGMSNSGIAPH